MISKCSRTPIGLLLSGGLDSCILLGHLLQEKRHVQPFYIRSQLAWQSEELLSAERFLAAVDSPLLKGLVALDLPLKDLYADHWSVTGHEVPVASSPDDAVYLPGRNALLTIKAALWCRLHGIGELALAVLRSNPFPDATDEFFDAFESALDIATGGPATGGRVHIVRPFAKLDKSQVMALGCGLPLQLTFSCISPVKGRHCGKCNKCAERSDAFRLIEADDPTEYAADHIGT